MLAENWGATDAERVAPMPCDELLPNARFRCHRAITVAAARAVVFRWLCQLRRAPYSYDLLDNLGRRSPPTLTSGLDRLAIGQRFMTIFRLASFDRDEQITLRARSAAVTYAVLPGGRSTRLVVCVRFDPASRVGAALAPPLVLGDLVMMRKQLLTLRDLAEGEAARAQPVASSGAPR